MLETCFERRRNVTSAVLSTAAAFGFAPIVAAEPRMSIKTDEGWEFRTAAYRAMELQAGLESCRRLPCALSGL